MTVARAGGVMAVAALVFVVVAIIRCDQGRDPFAVAPTPTPGLFPGAREILDSAVLGADTGGATPEAGGVTVTLMSVDCGSGRLRIATDRGTVWALTSCGKAPGAGALGPLGNTVIVQLDAPAGMITLRGNDGAVVEIEVERIFVSP